MWESVEFQAFLHECYTFVIELRVPHVFGAVAPYRHVQVVDLGLVLGSGLVTNLIDFDDFVVVAQA